MNLSQARDILRQSRVINGEIKYFKSQILKVKTVQEMKMYQKKLKESELEHANMYDLRREALSKILKAD